jgi:hypothetical protein
MPNIGFIISMYCHMAGQCHIWGETMVTQWTCIIF